MRVAVCDSGQPRNAPSHGVHGFFGSEGVDPAELRKRAREQLRPFAVELRDALVVKAIQTGGHFEVVLQDGAILASRRILFATGVVDLLPEVEGFNELWGTSVFHCPYCHAWEVRDQPLAVYGNDHSAVEKAVLLTGWTTNLMFCTDGSATLSEEDERKLASARIPIQREKIRRLQASGGELEAIEFEDGRSIRRRGIFLTPRLKFNSALAGELGCALGEKGQIRIDGDCRTNVAGVYAAGECTATNQVIAMAAEGAKAAYAITRDLIHEDLEKRVQSAGAVSG